MLLFIFKVNKHSIENSIHKPHFEKTQPIIWRLFYFFEIIICCFVVAIVDLVHDVEAIFPLP